MNKICIIIFGHVVLLQFFLINIATCQPVAQDPRRLISDPTLVDRIVRETVQVNPTLVVASRDVGEVKGEDEVHWLKRHPVLGGMVIGLASGFSVGFVRCLGIDDFTVAGAMIFCGGYGAGIGAGIGAVVGKVISEK